MNERQEIKNLLRAYLPKAKGPLKYSSIQKKLDAVVTTYSYFSSEKSDDRSFLRKFDWDYVSALGNYFSEYRYNKIIPNGLNHFLF